MSRTLLLLIASLVSLAGAEAAATANQMEMGMKIVRVEVVEKPMIYVTATASMAEIPTFMGVAFKTLGEFFITTGVVPIGPPMAVYHDWSGNKTAVDVGFPVSPGDASKATVGIHAGMSPGGHALKAVHVGAYNDFPATYAAIGAAMRVAGIPDSTIMWEVYLGEPGKTPEADLITEIYVKVTAEDAAKFPLE